MNFIVFASVNRRVEERRSKLSGLVRAFFKIVVRCLMVSFVYRYWKIFFSIFFLRIYVRVYICVCIYIRMYVCMCL